MPFVKALIPDDGGGNDSGCLFLQQLIQASVQGADKDER